MKRLDDNIGSFKAALWQAPEVFNPVRMHVAFDIGLGVIDDLMDLLAI
jgi:hypothetical protein